VLLRIIHAIVLFTSSYVRKDLKQLGIAYNKMFCVDVCLCEVEKRRILRTRSAKALELTSWRATLSLSNFIELLCSIN